MSRSARWAIGMIAVLSTLFCAPLWIHSLTHREAAAAPALEAGRHLQPAGLASVLAPTIFGGAIGARPLALIRQIRPFS